MVSIVHHKKIRTPLVYDPAMSATETVVCPSCEARGVIEGIAPEVVPEQIKCGACKHVFAYHPSRYDILRQDYDGELDIWPMKVTVKAPGSPSEDSEDPEAVRLGHLASVATKRLLGAFRDARQGRFAGDNDPVRIRGLWHLSFTSDEVRAELAKREHVPNKQEARALRRARAQGHDLQPRDPVKKQRRI